MGLTDKTILSVAENAKEAARELILALLDEDSELLSLYYGAETTEEEAEALADEILEEHDEIDVEVQFGGQPIYSYFISVE